MSHTKFQINEYQRQLGYGDYKKIRDRLANKGIKVSKAAITHVIAMQSYYNADILDMAKAVLKDKAKNNKAKSQTVS